MKRNLMALPCLLALVLACGQGRTEDQDTGAVSGGVEDTTAAPSTDMSDTGLTPADTAIVGDTGASAPQSGDTTAPSGAGATSDTAY